MTTTTQHYNGGDDSGPGKLILAGLFILSLFFVITMAVGTALQGKFEQETAEQSSSSTRYDQIAPIVSLPDIVLDIGPDGKAHADHGHPEAQSIRDCLDRQGGAYMIFRSFDKRSFYALCQLTDGRWGFREFVQDAADRLWHEVNAFIPKDGSWSRVIDYLGRSGSKFNGPFPW
jgi:hypothetical protein